MQNLRQVLLPTLGTLAALIILVGSYYFAKSAIPPIPSTPPATYLPVLMMTTTPDPFAALLTPPSVERGPDGRYISQDVPLIIADNSREGAVSHITVPDHFTVDTVQLLNLKVTHPDTGELVVRLLAPDLTLVTLVDHICPGAHNWFALTLQDQAARLVGSECADNLNNGYRPPPGHELTAFSGVDAQGDWAVSVVDTRPGNIGTLQGWSLLFNAPISNTATITASIGTATISPNPPPSTSAPAPSASPTILQPTPRASPPRNASSPVAVTPTSVRPTATSNPTLPVATGTPTLPAATPTVPPPTLTLPPVEPTATPYPLLYP